MIYLPRGFAAACLVLALALTAQAQPPDSGLWPWPEAAVGEALSYIRVLPQDLSLRTDYVKVDPWRLKTVDQAMAQPTSMPQIMQSIVADRAIRGENEARHIRLRARDVSVKLLQIFGETRLASGPVAIPNAAKTGLSIYWLNWLSATLAACADSTRIERILAEIPERDRHLFLTDAVELATEEESINTAAAETIDSLQKARDTLAAHILAYAGRVRWWDNIMAMAFAVDERVLSLPTQAPLPPEGGAPGKMQILRTAVGDVVIGTAGKDTYTGSPVAIIDPGGDDVYELAPMTPGRARVVVDWSGDDLYQAPDGLDLGCGFWNLGLLIDVGGDDTYRGGNFTLGAGWFGVGALYDLGGRDVYEGDAFTQGAGAWGMGLFFDAGEGNDRCNAAMYAQGFGFAAGVGVLMDDGGNDSYFAGGKYQATLQYADRNYSLSQGFGYGARPYFSGGVGLLFDLGGHDLYVTDIFGQGSAYWWAFGGLYDAGGNDQYSSYQYAQGAGAHMSAGCLFDRRGDDMYASKGVSQGCGHDWSQGYLIDASGNDRYTCSDLSQAAGSANGVGVLIDGSGDDTYNARDTINTQGYGNPRRDYGSIGLFLDLDGADRYIGPGRDRRIWLSRSLWGVGVDADSTWLRKVTP
ncbi:MAG TPA: hypothetical protein VNN55_08850 [bacterium]|nr:hypothetical protein [bacterium]